MLAHIHSIRKWIYTNTCIAFLVRPLFFSPFILHLCTVDCIVIVQSIRSQVPHSINYVAKLPKEIEAHIVEYFFPYLMCVYMSICDAVLRQFVVSVLIRFVLFFFSVQCLAHAMLLFLVAHQPIAFSVQSSVFGVTQFPLCYSSILSLSSFSLHFNSVSAIQRSKGKKRCCWLFLL